MGAGFLCAFRCRFLVQYFPCLVVFSFSRLFIIEINAGVNPAILRRHPACRFDFEQPIGESPSEPAAGILQCMTDWSKIISTGCRADHSDLRLWPAVPGIL